MSYLNIDKLALKVDSEKRKKEVENLFCYATTFKESHARFGNFTIPFYLLEKKDLYENIVKYIFGNKGFSMLPFKGSKSSKILNSISKKN